MERIEQLILYEELENDVPLIAFERRRDTGSKRLVENVAPLSQFSPQPTLEVSVSADTPILIEDDIEEEK